MPDKPKKESALSAPMCRLCHTRHWNNQPHHFAPTKKKKRRRE